MFEFLWDLRQDHMISQARSRADDAAIGAAEAAQRVADLQRENERLTTVTMALWSLMKDRLALEDEELQARVTEIARAQDDRSRCERCRRKKSPHTGRCIYCR